MADTPTSTELLNKINEAAGIIQEAQQTILEAKAGILAAPQVAADAKSIAQQAKATADAAATKTALDAVKATADGALPLNGSKEMTGPLIIKSNNLDLTTLPASNQYGKLFAVRDKNDINLYYLEGMQYRTGGSRVRIAANTPKDEINQLSAVDIVSLSDGTTYATCPPPRPDNYGTDIVNAKAMKDFAIQQLTTNRIASIANNTAKLPDGGTWACMGANAANVKICAGGTAPGFVCNAFRVA